MLTFVYWIEISWLMVDAISGLFQHNGVTFLGGQNISALVRAGSLGIMLVVLVQHAGSRLHSGLSMLPMAVIWVLVQATHWGFSAGEAVINLQFLAKCAMPLVLYCVLQIQLQHGALSARRIQWIVGVNAVTLLVNLALPMAGLGFAQYGLTADGELLGGKGFFYAGNEVAAVTVGLFALLIIQWRNYIQQHAAWLATLTVCFLLAALSSASKTAAVGVIVLAALALFSLVNAEAALKAAFVGATALAVTSPVWMPVLDRVADHWVALFGQSNDLLSFATSGRVDRIGDFREWLASQSSGPEAILGRGYLGEEAQASFENDLLDLLYCYGLLGLAPFAMLMGWVSTALSAAGPARKADPWARFAGVALALLLAASVGAGHVVYSVMLAPFLALLALPQPAQAGKATDIIKANTSARCL